MATGLLERLKVDAVHDVVAMVKRWIQLRGEVI